MVRFQSIRSPWYLAFIGSFAFTVTFIAKLAGLYDKATAEGWVLTAFTVAGLIGVSAAANKMPRVGEVA